MSEALNAVKAPRLKNRKIGIFAGAFDPIHDGHIEIGKSAVNVLNLDYLYFMVEKQPWTSKKPIDVKHRKKMVDIALDKIAKLLQLNTDYNRFTLAETLPELEKRFTKCELYFIFGADVFLNMNSLQWPGLERLLKHYIVVFERKSVTEYEITQHAKSLGIVCAILPNSMLHHSSTDVRLRPREKSIWIPKSIANYIENNNLYK